MSFKIISSVTFFFFFLLFVFPLICISHWIFFHIVLFFFSFHFSTSFFSFLHYCISSFYFSKSNIYYLLIYLPISLASFDIILFLAFHVLFYSLFLPPKHIRNNRKKRSIETIFLLIGAFSLWACIPVRHRYRHYLPPVVHKVKEKFFVGRETVV